MRANRIKFPVGLGLLIVLAAFEFVSLNAEAADGDNGERRQFALDASVPIGFLGNLSDWGDGFADSGAVPLTLGINGAFEYRRFRFISFGLAAQADVVFWRDYDATGMEYYSVPVFIPFTLRGVLPLDADKLEIYLQGEVGLSVLKDKSGDVLVGPGFQAKLGARRWLNPSFALFAEFGAAFRLQDDGDESQSGQNQSLAFFFIAVGASFGL